MKICLVLLAFLFLFSACRPYQHSCTTTSIDIAKYSEITLEEFRTKKELPRRVRNNWTFKKLQFAVDSNDFVSSQDKVLLINGAFNKAKKYGYMIYLYKQNHDSLTNIACVSFNVLGKVLNYNHYLVVPMSIHSFEEAKPFMTVDNMGLFGGLVVKTKKEYRQLIRQLPRKERKKERKFMRVIF